MKLPILIFIISAIASSVMAESDPSLIITGDFIGIQKNESGSNRTTYIRKDQIISIVVLDVDSSVHREKPALVITTKGLSVQKNIDRSPSGQTQTTMASESLSYYFIFDSYKKAEGAAELLTR